MNLELSVKRVRLAALAFVCGAAFSAVSPPASAAGLSDLITLPEGTVEDSLPNGLRYILLPNGFPAGRTEFRLIWRVGAVQQDDSQGGCAHFLEHMAFGGSENFPERGAVAYLESMGMKYGIDINAFTGHDRTIYMFATPSDSLRDTGYAKPLSIIRDWTDRLTINPQRVETEKGIILEELRSSFQDDPFYDLKIGQNRFSSRMPLGTPDEVSRMTAQVLEDYYRKWYVPQLGAVVVVGDIDPTSVEREIRRQFSSLPAKADPGFRSYSLDYNPSRRIMLDVDSLNNRDEAEIIIPHPASVTRTLDDARRKEAGNIAVAALARRFSDLGIKADVSDAWYLGATNHLVFTAREDRDADLGTCISALAAVVRTALEYGFSKEEIKYHADRAARRLGKISRAGSPSDMWCEDFADYVISGDRYISDPGQIAILQKAVAEITPEEVGAILKDWVACMDSTVLVAVRTSPKKAPDHTLDAILGRWHEGFGRTPEKYVFTEPVPAKAVPIATPAILAKRHPFNPDQIVSVRDYASLGIREYTLSNGIMLITRPTTGDDAAMFAMIAPGGYSSIEPSRLPLLGGAASYIDMGGIAKVHSDTLGDYLYQNDMALSTTLGNDWHGFLGAFEPTRSGEFFNLVYEKITAPELRYADFEDVRASMLDDVGHESMLTRMLSRASDRQLMARMDELMCNTLDNGAAYRGVADRDEAQREFIRRMSLDSIAAFYTGLYANPNGSVYIISGNFTPDSIAAEFAPVFSRFVPSDGPAPRMSPLNLPETTLTERFDNENESQTEFDYVYFGRFTPGLRNSLVLKLMSNLLRNRIISELREHRALVYSPYVSLTYEGLPRGYFYFDINSSTENANMTQIHSALRDVIARLRDKACDQAELDAIKRSCIIARRETLTPYSPSAWRTTLVSLVKNGESIEDFDRYESIIESITPEEIRAAFNQLINPDLYLLLYMSDQNVSLK